MSDLRFMDQEFFDRPVEEVARALVGATLEVDGVGGIIVETEAYAGHDPASHSFRGRTLRNAAMFGEPGTAYVYRSYGLHWCLNAVCQPGSAVLLRALEPKAGMDIMLLRRGANRVKTACAGPGRLCQALGVTDDLNGCSLLEAPFHIIPAIAPIATTAAPRIGISRAMERPWRFGLSGSPFLSRRFPTAESTEQPLSASMD